MTTDPKAFEKWLQSRLTSHGFPVGPIDGDIGPLTTTALNRFQTARGLPVTNKADSATVEALRATSVGPVSRPAETVSPPPARPARGQWPTQGGVPKFYGKVGTGQVLMDLPFPMRIAWDLQKIVTRISIHEKVADSAARVFDQIAAAYPPGARSDAGIDIFGGALNVRKMRGGTAWSMHSWGIAIDFDPVRNQLNWGKAHSPRPRLSMPDLDEFWSFWEAEGWVSLGRERDFDWMHVQAARL